MKSNTLFLFASFLTVVVASSVDCVINDLKEVAKMATRLDCALLSYHHYKDGSKFSGITHDVKPLAHIYKLSITLDDQLDSLIDDVQCSCDFSTDDSERVLFTIGEASEPILKTLEDFKAKHCEFIESVGPGLTHRVIGGSLKRTRCLTLDMLRSIECRIDHMYKEMIATMQSDVDSAFQQVLSIY